MACLARKAAALQHKLSLDLHSEPGFAPHVSGWSECMKEEPASDELNSGQDVSAEPRYDYGHGAKAHTHTHE